MLDALFGILIIIVAVWVVRRLLDLERGRWLVTLAAVLVGEACTLIVFKVVTKTATDIPLRSLFGVYALVTVFAMLTVVLVELISRPRAGRRLRGIPHPILGIRRLTGRTIQYGQVSMIGSGTACSIRVATPPRYEVPGSAARWARRSRMPADCS
jgi:hypothetical protein